MAVFLPIWAYLYTQQRDRGGTAATPLSAAAAFPWTAVLSVTLELPLMLPSLLGADAAAVQRGVVYFFLGPPVFSAFQALLASRVTGGGTRAVKAAYWVLAGVSGAVHVGCVIYAVSSDVALDRLFVPHGDAVRAAGQADILTEAAFLFLQWDYVVINVTVLLLCTYILKTRPGGPRAAKTQTGSGFVTALLALTAVFGPGVGLAYAACCEEHDLQIEGPQVPGKVD